ncbi:ZYRO0G13200p [Zygosaccharomyces rouxii]|uniref:DNA polymerase alpha subunit B n=1 Tax=Zygosaccharomyces rouxii (strain ATCC 2623 / CBS 732 / NBRC 1130 / NCYC 568 / NRRL Y-229) TaxID=559307 RepID=C5E0J3_ZYGRC|nr:uncharacterized protein ZYRO0G13200g [Zygosaccharomyces rouxii]KAH9202620.1 DNA polymerase alpha subunit B N-terminal-domain-containing protein [Zygosaccharomyces rouxii]CAR29627.1 ZYRO0G13200p [Zygosaccharomyces rouxii]
MNTKNEIVVHFGPAADKPEIVSALEHLTKLHALTIDDLYVKWEQFSNQKNFKNANLDPVNLDNFKQYLQLQIEKRAAKAPTTFNHTNVARKPKPVRSVNGSPTLFGLNVSKTPTLKRRKMNDELESDGKSKSSPLHFSTTPLSANSTPGPDLNSMAAIPSQDDIQSGKILDSLNSNNLEIATGIDVTDGTKLKISPYYDPEKYHFRTMRQSLIDVADVLDEQIEILSNIVQNHYQLQASDFGDPTIQAQSELYTVGRIVPDSSSSEDHLNEESLALETSRMGGVGRRIRLDLSNVNEVSFFCGQIVALKGKNANDEYFTVSEVLSLPYPDSPTSTLEELQETSNSMNGKPSKIVITSGPYIPDNSFSMINLDNFVERINTEIKPHVLVMFGPFIDYTNSMIAKGTIPIFPNLKIQPKTLDEIFIKVMAPILKNIDSQIQVIMIPSTRDTLSKHAAYPQDSFDRKALHLPKNFKCFANPSTFQLNEVFFGCSNVDIFKDMKEVTRGGNIFLRNRFDRISEHLLQQRRFYPVFPGGVRKKLLPSSTNSERTYQHISGADLEVAYMGLTEFVDGFAPDIIVIPSELPQFARVVQNVVMINPGRFIKPLGAKGTYAQITISSPDLESGLLTEIKGESSVYLHNVWKRARVDLITI